MDGQQSLLSAPSKKIGERNCGLQIGAREKTEQGDVWPDLCRIIEDNMQRRNTCVALMGGSDGWYRERLLNSMINDPSCEEKQPTLLCANVEVCGV